MNRFTFYLAWIMFLILGVLMVWKALAERPEGWGALVLFGVLTVIGSLAWLRLDGKELKK